MAEATAEKILGKFDTPEARDKALEEIHKKVLGEEVPLPAFKDDEAKNKAYTAYEKAMRNPPTNGAATPPAPKKEEVADPAGILSIGTGGDDDPDVDALLVKAGLDGAEVTKQWTEHGHLTDAQYAALKKVGYGRKLADTIATGQHARAVLAVQQNQAIRAQAIEVVGGEEAFKNLDAWASANLPKERLDSLNAMVKASPKAYPEVVRMIKAEHAQALGAGKAQPLVTGSGGTPGTAIDSWAQIRALNRKAAAGDQAAAAQVKQILSDPEKKKKLK